MINLLSASMLAIAAMLLALLGALWLFQPHYHCSLIDGGRAGAKVEMRTFPLFGDANCDKLASDMLEQERGKTRK